MVVLEWLACYFQLFGMRRLSLGNGETALLLTYLSKGIERIQGTTEVLHMYITECCRESVKCLTIGWCSV